MKDIIVQIGKIALGVFIVVTLILGSGALSFQTGSTNVMNRSNTEINKIVNP